MIEQMLKFDKQVIQALAKHLTVKDSMNEREGCRWQLIAITIPVKLHKVTMGYNVLQSVWTSVRSYPDLVLQARQ